MASEALPGHIELWLLWPEMTREALAAGCAEAIGLGGAAVCVHGSNILQVSHLLQESRTKVAAAVGFPFGANDTDVKRFETEVAVDHGAQEINLALNIARIKESEQAYVRREVRDVVEAADERPVKVVLESGLLTPDEVLRACDWLAESGAQGVVVSARLGAKAPEVEQVRRVRQSIPARWLVAAAGTIPSPTSALALVEAGAARLGISPDQPLWQILRSSVTSLQPSPHGSSPNRSAMGST